LYFSFAFGLAFGLFIPEFNLSARENTPVARKAPEIRSETVRIEILSI
jgi:hypothetical protein